MENNKLILKDSAVKQKHMYSHSDGLSNCSKENTQLIFDILKLLKGKSAIFSKEILKVCLEEIDYVSTINGHYEVIV